MPIDKFGRHMLYKRKSYVMNSNDPALLASPQPTLYFYKQIIPIYSQANEVQVASGQGVTHLYALNGTGEVTFPLEEGVVEYIEIYPSTTAIYLNKSIDPHNLKGKTLHKGDTLAFSIDLHKKDPLYVVLVVKCPLEIK